MERVTIRRIVTGLGLAMVVAACFGCARARVRNVQADRSLTLPRPGRVLVFDFETGGADVRVGSSPRRTVRNAVGLYVREADVLADAVAGALASQLVADISARGFTAERAAQVPPPRLNDLIVQGQFVQIEGGSATGRFVIGLGVGATELRTQVEVFQVTADGWRPVKQFDTVAAGSRMPGAAFFVAGGAAAGTVATSAIITSGVGVVREVRASLEGDARRTSEQITTQLADLSTAQRW
jgi:hypothetical protein